MLSNIYLAEKQAEWQAERRQLRPVVRDTGRKAPSPVAVVARRLGGVLRRTGEALESWSPGTTELTSRTPSPREAD